MEYVWDYPQGVWMHVVDRLGNPLGYLGGFFILWNFQKGLKDSFRKFLISSAKQLTIFGEDRGVKICLLILFAEKLRPIFCKENYIKQ